MVNEILFERNAARHDGSELHVVHRTAAGIGSEVFFHHFFAIQSMPAARPVRVAASVNVFTSFLSDMLVCGQTPNIQNKINRTPLHLSRRHR